MTACILASKPVQKDELTFLSKRERAAATVLLCRQSDSAYPMNSRVGSRAVRGCRLFHKNDTRALQKCASKAKELALPSHHVAAVF